MSDREKKERRVLNDALDAIEDFAGRYDMESEANRLLLVQLLAGLSLATILDRCGPFRALRTVFGAIVIAFRFRGLVKP